MNISLDWLQDFINIPKNITPEKLGEILTLHTVEVEGILKSGDNLENIIVGKIIKLKEHPNADKLRLAVVSDGQKEYQVVCGGINLYEGMLVALAKVGAKVKWHGEGELVELEPVKIRGEESAGMICAASEIGLENLFPADDDREVVDLKGGYQVGDDLSKTLKSDDVVYDIDNKSMTHRPDLWGHYGIARELATLMDTDLKQINTDKVKAGGHEINVKVEDVKLCPRYMAVAIEGIEIKPSTELIQKRLTTCGMRPINNIIDITNYVMLELGQPTHAFDAKKLGDKIGVRLAKAGEKLITLDEQERKLDDEMLLITDGKQPIAIAGIMGGGNSEIDKNTSSIILESANFNPVSVRQTSQKLGLRTDASQRYEKSLDPNLCELAVNRIIDLIKESCPQAEVNGLIDENNFKLEQGPIKLDIEWLQQKIGVKISKTEVTKILNNLGFKTSGDKILNVEIPSWRATKDISIPEDLVEEIARVYGYKKIAEVMPKIDMETPKINIELNFVNRIKDILATAGMSETYNYPFVNETQLEKLKINYTEHIKIANPLTSDCTLLRQSLIPNLLQNVIANQRNYNEVKIFEIGTIFLNENGELSKTGLNKEKLPAQPKKLGMIYASNEKNNYYKLKGIIEYLFNELRINIPFEITEFNKGTAGNIGIKTNLVFCELNIDELLTTNQESGIKKYQPKNKFPSLERDMAFVVDEKVLYNDIREEILTVNKLIKAVDLFDLYRGDKLGTGKKSLAMHIIFEDSKKTLTGKEVDKVQKKVVKTLEKKFKAQLRNF